MRVYAGLAEYLALLVFFTAVAPVDAVIRANCNVWVRTTGNAVSLCSLKSWNLEIGFGNWNAHERTGGGMERKEVIRKATMEGGFNCSQEASLLATWCRASQLTRSRGLIDVSMYLPYELTHWLDL